MVMAQALAAAVTVLAAQKGTIPLAADADEHDFADRAKLPMTVAVHKALQRAPGVALWAGLENDGGFLFYGVEIACKDGSLKSVTLDAGNGRVAGVTSRTKAEAARDAAKEAAEDAAKAKADPKSEEARKAKEAAREKGRAARFVSSVRVGPKAGQHDLALAAKISMLDAMKAASRDHPGKFSSVSLVADQGNVLYAVTVKSAAGRFTLVWVDAGSAAVVGEEEGG